MANRGKGRSIPTKSAPPKHPNRGKTPKYPKLSAKFPAPGSTKTPRARANPGSKTVPA